MPMLTIATVVGWRGGEGRGGHDRDQRQPKPDFPEARSGQTESL